MISLDSPSMSPVEVFDACGSKVQHGLDRAAFSRARLSYASLPRSYNLLASGHRLHQYRSSPVGDLTVEHHRRMYENHLVGGASRPVYEQILVGSPSGRCAYCGVGVAASLDHYLPLGQFPELSVLPRNLVPACADCNRSKGEFTPSKRADELFHPYFDAWADEIRLTATPLFGEFISVRYSVVSLEGSNPMNAERATHHLERLKLDRLYRMNAMVELSERKRQLEGIFEVAGADGLRRFLVGEVDSRAAAERNGWRAALCQGLADSDEFCDGGFAQILS